MNTLSRISEQPAVATPWPIKFPQQPAESANPADVASLSTQPLAETAAPRERRPGLLALGALTVVGVGVAASLLGPSGAGIPPVPVAGTTVSSTAEARTQAARNNAPVTLSQEDGVSVSLETADVGITLPSRPFGPSARGARIDTNTEQRTRAVDGRTVTLDVTQSKLCTIDGRELHLSDDMDSVRDAFDSDARENWRLNSTMTPAGSAGRYLSVALNQGGQTDGRHDGKESRLRTVDATTGEVVTLDELLGESDFENVLSTVRNVLERNPDGHEYMRDSDQLRQQVATSFGLNEEGGRTVLTVAVPQLTLSENPTVARVEFHLPAHLLR